MFQLITFGKQKTPTRLHKIKVFLCSSSHSKPSKQNSWRKRNIDAWHTNIIVSSSGIQIVLDGSDLEKPPSSFGSQNKASAMSCPSKISFQMATDAGGIENEVLRRA